MPTPFRIAEIQPNAVTSEPASKAVLVAEDDPMFQKLLKSWLQTWGYRVTLAEDGDQAWQILQEEDQPEILILDWVMPGVDGVELCRRIRERVKTPYQYILLVTAKDDSSDLVTGLESGADDYLTKPFARNELRARLTVAQRILSLQDGLLRAQEELRFQATHDVLTGIWNRRAVLNLLQREVERASRTNGVTGVLMLDLDHFKKINDSYGHIAGDAVLREVAQRITHVIRSYDFVGRHGGEEFLVVLPDCDRVRAFQSAERIRSTIAGHPIPADGRHIAVTASIGVAAADCSQTEAEILATADAALYQAKGAGRNHCVAL
jgi:diguanylate cyclase (GGDEF)-like protein